MLILAVPLIQTSRADAANIADSTAKDKLSVFLSSVIGLDLTKYNVTVSSGVTYPSNFGGLVKQEVISCQLDYNGNKIGVMGIFYNEFIFAIDILPNQGPLIYTQPSSTNAIDKAKSIIQKYQIFAKNYGIDNSHLTTALSMLNKVTDLTPSSTISGNMKLVVSCITSSEANSARNLTSFTWIYTANGVDVYNKRLEIDFEGNATPFKDTWGLFTIGSFSVISEAEAKNIGFEAAKNYDLRFLSENGTLFSVHPKWSDMAEVKLNMIPGQIYNLDPNDKFVNPGNATRDPLALYPLWEMVFYFSESIGNVVGIAVGVWGDTGEIAYITPYGYLGSMGENPQIPTETLTPPEPPTTPSENPAGSENNENTPLNTYLIGGIAATAIAAAIATIALKKKQISKPNK